NALDYNVASFAFYDVVAKIEFKYLLVNKTHSDFIKVFDNNMFNLQRLIFFGSQNYKDSNLSSSILIQYSTSCRITNGNRVEGNYFLPTLEVGFRVNDNTEIENFFGSTNE